MKIQENPKFYPVIFGVLGATTVGLVPRRVFNKWQTECAAALASGLAISLGATRLPTTTSSSPSCHLRLNGYTLPLFSTVPSDGKEAIENCTEHSYKDEDLNAYFPIVIDLGSGSPSSYWITGHNTIKLYRQGNDSQNTYWCLNIEPKTALRCVIPPVESETPFVQMNSGRHTIKKFTVS